MTKIDRRAFLHGLGGVSLALPALDAMGAEVTERAPPALLRALHGERDVTATC